MFVSIVKTAGNKGMVTPKIKFHKSLIIRDNPVVSNKSPLNLLINL